METKIIERYGGLIKEEPLTCLDAEIIAPHTCVMEADAPFFGYYNVEPHHSIPHYIYLILSGHHSFESIIRATQSIRAHYKKPFDATPGSITVYGTTCQVIRIRNIQNFSDISILQSLYLEEGIALKKKSRKITGAMSMIRLKKFFYIEPLGYGLYLDRGEPHHGYFTITHKPDWNSFKDFTRQVKYDPAFFHFDAALCFFYEQGKVVDLVRIYRENISVDELMSIRDKYFKVMKLT